MPANLPPDYFAAEQRFHEAKTPEDKVESLEEMLAIMPKHPDTEQPRKDLDPAALQELTESIRQQGVLQPILFRQDKGGLLYAVAGERRCAAARMAGLIFIPALYAESANYDELALIENILIRPYPS